MQRLAKSASVDKEVSEWQGVGRCLKWGSGLERCRLLKLCKALPKAGHLTAVLWRELTTPHWTVTTASGCPLGLQSLRADGGRAPIAA